MSLRAAPSPTPARQSPGLIAICAVAALLGALALTLSILIAPLFVPDYDWIADTISDLGAGEYEFIVDIGLYAYGTGLAFLAVGSAHTHPGGTGWSIGTLILVALAFIVIIIGARNEYGDGDSEGVVIHVYLVYALGLGFAVAPFAMAGGAGSGMAVWFRALGALWCLAAPVFFFLPTGMDGVYERGLGVIALAWTSCLAWLLWTRAARGPA